MNCFEKRIIKERLRPLIMKNADIAAIFYAMADILEIQKVQWKPIAYRKAARAIETLSEPIEDVYSKGGLKALMEISGVGEAIAKKTAEFIETGHVKEYEKLKKEMPQGLGDLVAVPGLGPKKAYRLFEELDIRSLADLEKAAHDHRIAPLEGFGKKSEENILKSLELVKTGQKRTPIGIALPIAEEIVGRLRKAKGVIKVEAAGSLRRRAETVGDLDILVSVKSPEDSGPVMDKFTSMPEVVQILAKGPTKSMIVIKEGNTQIQADVRVVEEGAFGAALQYFTGNKEHNIEMRRIAISKGWKLSEYGIFDKNDKRIAGKTEEEVYAKLGLPWMTPELRENHGEIPVAMKGELPTLVELKDIRGDMHVHSDWSDGVNTIEEMVAAARKRGYEYIVLADHSYSERIAGGLDDKTLLKQIEEVKKIRRNLKGIALLHGAEVSIQSDGELDFSDEMLKRLDVVTASVHSGFKSTKTQMTERVLHALDNKHVKVFNHPTGRLINERPPYEIDMDRLIEKCADRKIALEINSFPERLDLNDQHAKKAIEAGVKLTISTDSHSVDHLRFIEYGVSVARRAWAEKKDVVNTMTLKELAKYWNLKI
jgi:DNA polymerase (family 10)